MSPPLIQASKQINIMWNNNNNNNNNNKIIMKMKTKDLEKSFNNNPITLQQSNPKNKNQLFYHKIFSSW